MDTFLKRAAIAATLVVAPVVLAERGGVIVPSNKLDRPAYQTYAPISLFVDPASGNDTNACTSSGASACLTMQGALNKLPKLIRHPVTISAAAGDVRCFYISGHTGAPIGQADAGATGAYIDIVGTAAASTTLATGTATGTSTSGTAGSTSTFGTLTDTTQTWTVNDLRGRFVTHGSQYKVIVSNTVDTVTVAGVWTSPGAGTAYTIEDNVTLVTNACSNPPTAVSAVTANASAVYIFNNTMAYRSGGNIRLRALRFTNAAGNGVAKIDASTTSMQRLQFTSGMSTTVARVSLQNPSIGLDNLTDSSSILPSTAGFHYQSSSSGAQQIVSSYFLNGSTAFIFSSTASTANLLFTLSQVEGFATAGFTIGQSGRPRIANSNIIGGAASICVQVGALGIAASEGQQGMMSGGQSASVMSGCSIGVQVVGPSVWEVFTTSGTTATAFSATRGGSIRIDAATTATGSTTDLSVDGTSYSLATMRAASPKVVNDMSYFSKIYE